MRDKKRPAGIFLSSRWHTDEIIDRPIAPRSKKGNEREHSLFTRGNGKGAWHDIGHLISRRGVCPVVVAVRDDWTSREIP